MTSTTVPALELGGSRVEVTGQALSEEESSWVRGRLAAAGASAPLLRVEIESGDLDLEAGFTLPEGEPAEISWDGRVVSVRHPEYRAWIDPQLGSARLRRSTTRVFALQATLKVALASVLPRHGGLLLHAAAVVTAGRGVTAFFGPSGAGKSTLAATAAEGTVLTDELVAVRGPAPFQALASGFWGTLERHDPPPPPRPLTAIVELGRGEAFRLVRLDRRRALRRLLGVALLPPVPALWEHTLTVLASLSEATPAYRMEWTPARPPWDELASRGIS